MHGFLLALLVAGVAAFGSLPAADPGNPCLDPNDWIATNSIDRPPYCVVPDAISETKDTCEAAGCYWEEIPTPGNDSCQCKYKQLCESDTVGGTWTVSSLTCDDRTLLDVGASWDCASNLYELEWFAGGCCRGGAASSKCICETPDCAFNPCKDPNDFDPAAANAYEHCEGDEPGSNPIAASREACEAVGCEWEEGSPDDPCHCNTEQLCESPAVGGTWTTGSILCGSGSIQRTGSTWTCATDADSMASYAGVCCRGGAASSKCA